MRRSVRHGAVVALVVAVATALMASAPAAETPVRVIVFRGVQNLPIYAAQAQGFFARRDLKVDLQFTPNSMVLRDGLAKGQYDLAHTAVDNAIAMVELAKADVVVLMGGDNSLNGLYVQPDVRAIADLRGKTVAVDAPNTAYALQLYKMLTMNGVSRGEYTVKVVGGSTSRLEALLKDRTYAASMLNLPHSLLAERGGLRNLGMAVQALGAYQGTAAFAMRGWAQANRDPVVRYIQAYLDGLRWVKNPANKAEAAALLAERLKLDPRLAGQCYDIVADPNGGFATDAKLDLEGFKNVLKLRAEIEGQWGGTPPPAEKYLDLSYYERALAGR